MLRLLALQTTLLAHRLHVELDEDARDLRVATAPGMRAITIRCHRRADDFGALWYVTAGGEPLALADDAHLHEAITATKVHLHAGAPVDDSEHLLQLAAELEKRGIMSRLVRSSDRPPSLRVMSPLSRPLDETVRSAPHPTDADRTVLVGEWGDVLADDVATSAQVLTRMVTFEVTAS